MTRAHQTATGFRVELGETGDEDVMQMPVFWHIVHTLPIWLVGAAAVVAAGCGAMLVEVVTRQFLSAEFRRRHNDVTGAMFSIIGVTYAVLLAFVATLAWDGYNKAKSASYAEAEAALDVYTASAGLPDPERSALRDDLAAYVRAVVAVEWPAQAVGLTMQASVVELARINRAAFAPQPRGGADSDVRAILLQAVTRLADARQDRLVAAESSVPSVVWIVTILGGAITVAFSSFLGTVSLRLHLAMAASLAMSGALILVMIVALSNPFRGEFRVSTAPFEHVLTQIGGLSPDPVRVTVRPF